ncbi:OmpA family protein [Parahaliea aestuarii]|uniref:Outer membrane porin F N-terminal domain-containing protein n=1 Tax=Parahaliea aestuarii TaxID=1852021 RepID=A0A5C8ZUT5_9GAMM|nr:OmpA family protein [Parahaliea aestuarii]TXS92216.1 hypothetical protein FVW59_07235 [Parahaliea aestuarii]
MKKLQQTVALGFCTALLPVALAAAPQEGDREFSLSGTGTSDKDFDNSNFGISGDIGWYTSPDLSLGIRQSVSYADIEGEGVTDDAWNGSTRGYANYHFGSGNARPFLGASLGGIYGDNVKESAFAGLEFGLKYYVLESTYILGRAEYQFFFDSGDSAEDNFDDGAWAYVLGVGFNF